MADSVRARYYEELSELYSKLEDQLPQQAGNPCGECHACCTSDGLNQHNVTSLELDYLEERVGSERIEEFRTFLKRDGEIPLCPYYAEGCSIYPYRPYSCRVFGHFRREDTGMPEVCVFRGQEKIFGVGEYRATVPQSGELTALTRRYWAHRVQRRDLEDVVYQAAGLEDSLGQALDALSSGDVASALETMAAEDSNDPFTLYSKSLVLEEAGRPDLACELLQEALLQAPESPDLWHRLGCSLFALGHQDASERAFQNVVNHYPEHTQAWGLLGMHRMLNSDFQKAVEYLQRAVEIAPENAAFQARLEQARQLVGTTSG